MDEAFLGLVLFLILPITLVIFLSWILKKYAPRQKDSSVQMNLFKALNQYEEQNKNFVGKLIKYGLILLLFLAIGLKSWVAFNH